MQVTGNGLVTTVSQLVKNEGPMAFWKVSESALARSLLVAVPAFSSQLPQPLRRPLHGLKGIPFAWGREGSYASIKLGAYAPVRDAIGAGDKNSPVYLKFLAGAITGGAGSIVGNPFDV